MAKQMIQCPNCKYEGEGIMYTKGSFLMEVFLWLLFIVPGVFYSVWRLTTKGLVCPKCMFQHVVRVSV
jgi:hypothetical protein